jgi:hypothetical protein
VGSSPTGPTMRSSHFTSIMFTFGTDFLAWLLWGRLVVGGMMAGVACLGGSGWLRLGGRVLGCRGGTLLVNGGRGRECCCPAGYGGAAARLAGVVRRRFLVLGGSPVAARRALSAWRAR